MIVNRLFMAVGAVAVGFSCAFGQPKPPGASEGWGPCAEKPEALAADVDKAIGWLKNEQAGVSYNYIDKDGHGRSLCAILIKDSNTFRIEIPVLVTEDVKGKGSETSITKVTQIADGKRFVLFSSKKGFSSSEPLATAKVPSSTTITKWPIDFPSLIFSAVHGGKPLESLIAAARSAGLTMKIGERRYDYKGYIVHQKQLTVEKKSSAGGVLAIQILIDASQNLPVKIDGTVGPSLKAARAVKWSAAWGRPRSGKLNPAAFIVPKAPPKNAK